MCVNEVFGVNNIKRGINLDYVKKIFNTRMPYIVMISEEAGRLNYEEILDEFFDSSFNLRIGGSLGLSTRIIADINIFIKNSLRVMMDSIIITGISLFDNEEVYVDDIPEEIKNIFISDKNSEMTMSVVNTFLPIMSKQYLLNLKNKLSR